jgi:PHD/YefM family antitoxin component YafN of YafNO toxin-antitoxin module
MVLTQRGRGAAVLLDIDVYQAMLEELETLRDVTTARAQILEGRALSSQAARSRVGTRKIWYPERATSRWRTNWSGLSSR